ncbi:hypothetical protein PR048_019867 [Dryococelus australis]|uniref:Uncharacterized protein n=1 Tax=Dryococelus australis TaxID=614101 RepID=A0ABQ9H4P0_9NEOP|nr:hypothetical protein PR048_019867 [Dryococelus australis]
MLQWHLFCSLLSQKSSQNWCCMFVKQEVLQKAICVDTIDLKQKENLVLIQYVKLGYSGQSELWKHDLADLEMAKFKKGCREMLTGLCLKFLEKSLIKYNLCKGISFCDPSLFAKYKDTCIPFFDVSSVHGNAFVEDSPSTKKLLLKISWPDLLYPSIKCMMVFRHYFGGLKNVEITNMMI